MKINLFCMYFNLEHSFTYDRKLSKLNPILRIKLKLRKASDYTLAVDY